jgi:hypothetical protein
LIGKVTKFSVTAKSCTMLEYGACNRVFVDQFAGPVGLVLGDVRGGLALGSEPDEHHLARLQVELGVRGRGCEVSAPSKVWIPTVSRVSGSIWIGGLSSLDAMSMPSCQNTLVLDRDRFIPATDGSSVKGLG